MEIGDPVPYGADEDLSGSPSKTSKLCGVVGTIRLVAGTYIIVITSAKEVGKYLGFPIFRVQSLKYLPCNQAVKQLSPQEKKEEAYFRNLLRVVESTAGLYYSYETDITVKYAVLLCLLLHYHKFTTVIEQAYWLKRMSQLSSTDICLCGSSYQFAKKVELSRRVDEQTSLEAGALCSHTDTVGEKLLLVDLADPRFVWNRALLDDLIEKKLDSFIIPLQQGNILSLRTRMWRRGANLEGDAANFIETEQLVETKGFRSSFLQVRGSIPLLWEQIVDLSYKPRLKIINHEDTSKVVERHFHDLSQRYGEILALDLTDKHGDEGKLSSAYAAEMEKLPNVRYVSFDFHSVCGNSNFDNLDVLCNEIAEDFEKQGYFLIDKDGNVLEEQRGVIRSNCIDCLDRTNVTQSYLARISLDSQLQRIGIFSSEDSVTKFPEEYDKFKIMWVEHGDEISLEYAGTHALKRDLDAIDLISGHYSVGRNNTSALQRNTSEPFSYLPVASALLIGGLTLTSFSLSQGGRNAPQLVSSVVWAGVTAGVMALAKANGRQFCCRPRLCGLI
ncbi:LOW QUALITY PROTEIN: hypothetical protein Cgig2_021943 [Carnegiea gigantea]|uniref:SAC domain-containing protein n=1 Tax=Carnegiea gigantea TaxID=171969 RepID=A0A9Q1KSL8_9CARY|nr:LOW QUALITY PROTEIN: hypothetical protein Cgig2_021943 [Carnegiea gigantea]